MTTSSEKTTTIISPSSKSDIKELLSDLYIREKAWFPSGLGSRLHWGPPIEKPCKQVSVKNLNRIIEHCKEDLTITVEAGASLAEIQNALAKHQQWIPIDWPWGSDPLTNPPSSGSIGGLVARGLSGSLRHRHMNIRDQIIGIEILRTDGTPANAGGKVVKNVAGYDLMRLLCGSWGSLALITELTLRTQPIKKHRSSILLTGELDKLENCRIALGRKNITPEFFDWVDINPENWGLQIGLASVNNEAIESQLIIIENLSKENQLHTKRDSWKSPQIEGIEYLVPNESLTWLVRLAIPPSQIYAFINSQIMNELVGWKWRIPAIIGVGDGWQVYSEKINFSNPEAIKKLRDIAQELGGQITILTQPDGCNPRLYSWQDAKSRDLIKSIKLQFDPKNQLSKGRLPGVKS